MHSTTANNPFEEGLDEDTFEETKTRSAPPLTSRLDDIHITPSVSRSVVEESEVVLKPIPEYYERYTSTMCDMDVVGDADQLFRSLSNLMDTTEGVDFVPQKEKYQIDALHIQRGRACMFTINIFQCAGRFNDTGKDENWALVECSRKCGCVVEFNQFFSKVAALWKTEEEQQRRPRRGFMRPPSLEFKVKEDPNVVDVSYLKSLLAMADSDYYQAQQDGLSTLSHISAQKKNQVHLASNDVAGQVVGIIKKALKTPDNELKRCGATLLHNLSQEASISDAIAGSLAPAIEECLAIVNKLDSDPDNFTFMYHNLIRDSLDLD